MKALITVAAVVALGGLAIYVVTAKKQDAERYWTVVSMKKDGTWTFIGFERTNKGSEIRAAGGSFANQEAARVAANAWTSEKIAQIGGKA